MSTQQCVQLLWINYPQKAGQTQAGIQLLTLWWVNPYLKDCSGSGRQLTINFSEQSWNGELNAGSACEAHIHLHGWMQFQQLWSSSTPPVCKRERGYQFWWLQGNYKRLPCLYLRWDELRDRLKWWGQGGSDEYGNVYGEIVTSREESKEIRNGPCVTPK